MVRRKRLTEHEKFRIATTVHKANVPEGMSESEYGMWLYLRFCSTRAMEAYKKVERERFRRAVGN